jgi:hypothetical protein
MELVGGGWVPAVAARVGLAGREMGGNGRSGGVGGVMAGL